MTTLTTKEKQGLENAFSAISDLTPTAYPKWQRLRFLMYVKCISPLANFVCKVRFPR